MIKPHGFDFWKMKGQSPSRESQNHQTNIYSSSKDEFMKFISSGTS